MNLDQLTITGIRSFFFDSEPELEDNQQFHTIDLSQGLTIIKGKNGSGKTTIMEALKFALTGEHPPGPDGLIAFLSSNGNTEPPFQKCAVITVKGKQNGEDFEIRWQIFLNAREKRARDSSGNRISKIARRTEIRCTFLKNGELMHPSCEIGRNQAQKFIRGHISVPPVIFDNLLLVPQEEALWPFNTPGKLKEIFDIILNLQEKNRLLDKLMGIRDMCKSTLQSLQLRLPEAETLAREFCDKTNTLTNIKSMESDIKNKTRGKEAEMKQLSQDAEKFGNLKDLWGNIENLEKVLKSHNINDVDLKALDEASVKALIKKIEEDEQTAEAKLKLELETKCNLTKQLQVVDEELETAVSYLGKAQEREKNKKEAREGIEIILGTKLDPMSQDVKEEIKLKMQDMQNEVDHFVKEDECIRALYTKILLADSEQKQTQQNIESEVRHLDNLEAELPSLIELEGHWDFVLGFAKEQRNYIFDKRKKYPTDLTIEDLQQSFKELVENAGRRREQIGYFKGQSAICKEIIEDLQKIGCTENLETVEKYTQRKMELGCKLNLELVKVKSDIEKISSALEQLQTEELGRCLSPLMKRLEPLLEESEDTSSSNENFYSYLSSEAESNAFGLMNGHNSQSYLVEKQIKDKGTLLMELNRKLDTVKLKAQIAAKKIKDKKKNPEFQRMKDSVEQTRKSIIQMENYCKREDHSDDLEMYQRKKDLWDRKKKELKNCIEQKNLLIAEIQRSQQLLKDEKSEATKKLELVHHCLNLQETKTKLSTKYKLIFGKEQLESRATLEGRIKNTEQKMNQALFALKAYSAEEAATAAQRLQIQKELDGHLFRALESFQKLNDDLKEAELKLERATNDADNQRQSIINEHKTKIDDINTYLGDTWDSLYPHDDIASITLYADVKNVGEKRVDYDYHFEMILLGNNKLKMRGRSSYGEKVWASVVIRSALANMFAEGCLFAFDDPQNALDPMVMDQLVPHFVSILLGKRQLVITSLSDEFCNKMKDECGKHGVPIKIYNLLKEEGNSRMDIEG